MVIVINDNRVNDVEAYMPLAKAFIEDAKKDKGFIEMNIGVDKEIPGRVVYVSKWESKDDFINHAEGPAFKKHIPLMTPYYVSGVDTFLEEM